MWLRYFTTFADFIMCLFILFFCRALTWEKNKASMIGFVGMIILYGLNIIMMWS